MTASYQLHRILGQIYSVVPYDKEIALSIAYASKGPVPSSQFGCRRASIALTDGTTAWAKACIGFSLTS